MAHAGGRPRSSGHRPPCPVGHSGAIHFDGFRKRKTDALYARPLYRCLHAGNCTADCRKNCKGRHRFTGPEQARTHSHPDGLWCRECDRDRSLRDGTPVAHSWDFEARLIADALMAVGAGATYRDAATRMRIAARRYRPTSGRVPIPSNAGETVHRYLDHFGELVLAEVEHDAWPEVLVLDALPLRKREVRPDDPFSYEQSGNGAVLVAYGYTDAMPRKRRRKRNDEGELVAVPSEDRRVSHAWKIAVAGGIDRFSWLDFLASLPGRPKWIVVDGEAAVRVAIALHWGTGPDAPVVFSCEGHLQNKFRERARDEDHLPGIAIWDLWPKHKPGDPDPVPGPLWDRDHYRAFLDKVLAYDPKDVKNITSWIGHHDRTIRRQFDLREQHPGYPHGTGAVEAGIVKVEGWLGDRTRTLQNVRRMNIMLGLMHANLGGHADPALYSRVIRDELARTGGRPKLDWRAHHLAWRPRAGQLGPPGSLFRLADDARAAADADRRRYWTSAQASTMAKKVERMNDYHHLVGAPPLELTVAKSPSVKTGGRTVSDFPKFLDEWDPANERDPYTTPAGTMDEVLWICADVPTHRWKQPVLERIGRLLNCGQCNKLRGIAARAKVGGDPLILRSTLTEIRASWGGYEGTPPVSSAAPPLEEPAWLTEDLELAILEANGVTLGE